MVGQHVQMLHVILQGHLVLIHLSIQCAQSIESKSSISPICENSCAQIEPLVEGTGKLNLLLRLS